MFSINSTLTCQVDGLVKVYIYDKNAYFAFENEKKLNEAKEKVIRLWDRIDCTSFRFSPQEKPAEQDSLVLLVSSPKESKFSFGVSTKLATEGGSLIGETEELIKRTASIINSGTSDRTVSY
ncbi:MAG TPA: hypothetical protein VGZ69_01460 [Candidatus Rhabdochlamydia sp.]|jgi:hypothetical protein|nr:hypothetical protein [Candidatus Rhabdochlamydia sp.]